MMRKISNIIKDLEVELNDLQESLFMQNIQCQITLEQVYSHQILSVSTVENLESLAYQMQDEIRSFENDKRLKYWSELISTLCQEIHDLVVADGNIYKVAVFDIMKEQELSNELIFDNDFLESHLENLMEKAFDKLHLLLSNAEYDGLELEEKLKQVLVLLNAVLNSLKIDHSIQKN